MRRTKRIFALLLAMALCLPACGGGNGRNKNTTELAFRSAPNYTAVDVSLPADTGEFFGSCTDGKSIWFLLAGEESASAQLFRADLEDGTAEALEEYRPPEIPAEASQRRYGPVLAPDGTLWVYETWVVFHYDLPENFNPDTDLKGTYYAGQDEFLHLRQLDPVTGREKKLVDLSEAAMVLDLADTFGITDFTVDGEGRVYLTAPGGVAVLDGRGKFLFALEADIPDTGMNGSAGGRLVLLPDGTAAVLTSQPGGKRAVRTIDAGARDWGAEIFDMPGGAGALFSGREPCLFYYIRENVLYGVVSMEEPSQRLLALADTRLKGYGGTVCFALLDGGRLAVLTRRIPDSSRMNAEQLQLALLSPTDQLPEDGKIRITYGSIGENIYVMDRIRRFNEANDTYYVEHRDYSEGALAEASTKEELDAARDAAQKRLAGEIAAGRIPDILSSSLPLDACARAGLLEDLWPWIDNDPEISRENLMVRVLECASSNGSLYRIGGSFTIETAAASAKRAGKRTSWTLEEIMEAYGGTVPEIYWGSTHWQYKASAAQTLRNLLSMDLGRYVDWETGKCRFDREDFKDLLRLCASAGEEKSDGRTASPALWENVPVLCQAMLASVQDLTAWDAAFGGPESLNDYESRLWDAGVLYTFISPFNGQECTNYSSCPHAVNIALNRQFSYAAAGDAAIGAPDGKLYAAFPGFPSGSGAGSSFSLQDSTAVSASSRVKEGAWEFVRQLLLPGGSLRTESFDGAEFSSSEGFPMDRGDFERTLEPQWCRVDGDGEIILDQNGQPVEAAQDLIAVGDPASVIAYQMAPSQAQVDRFWALYNAIDHVSGGDGALLDIIVEQAQPYFAGDKSLAETAKLIQNRAALYVNENR